MSTMQSSMAARRAAQQGGFMLLEVLVAILIFAVGVLGLVGLQANAVQQSSLTKYRTDATLLANELVGQMWVGDRGFAALTAAFDSASAGPDYTAWKGKVEAVLPGASSYAPTVQLVQVAPLPNIVAGASAPADASLQPSTRVTITIRWKLPQDATADPARSYVMITEIRP